MIYWFALTGLYKSVNSICKKNQAGIKEVLADKKMMSLTHKGRQWVIWQSPVYRYYFHRNHSAREEKNLVCLVHHIIAILLHPHLKVLFC